MYKYNLIFLALLSFCFSCTEHTSQHLLYSKRNNFNKDSTFLEIEKDTNQSGRFAKYQALEQYYLLDTIVQAEIDLKLFKNTPSSDPTKYVYLEKIINKEAILKTTTGGKEILAEAFERHIEINSIHNKYDKVVQDCEKYLFYSNLHQDSIHKSVVLNILATSFQRLGDNKKATASLQESLNYSIQTKNPQKMIFAIANLANAYNENNEFDKAKLLINDAIKNIEMKGYYKEFILIWKANLEEDEHIKMQILKEIIKNTNSDTSLFACYKIMGVNYFENKNYSESFKIALLSTKISSAETREIAKQYLLLGKIEEALNKKDSAIYYYDLGLHKVVATEIVNHQVVPIYEKITPENTIYDLCIAKADLILQEKNSDSTALNTAILYLQSAKKVCDLLRQELLFDESKYETSEDLKLVSQRLLQIYFTLFTKYKETRFAQRAYIVAENARAVALQDNTERDILLNASADTNYAKFIVLRKELNALDVSMHEASSEHEKDSIHTLSNQVISQLGIYKSLSNAMLPAEKKEMQFEEVQQFLFKNKLNALNYFIGEDKLYILFLNSETNKIKFTQCDTSCLAAIDTLSTLQYQEHAFSSGNKKFKTLSNYIYRTLFSCVVEQQSLQHPILIFADGNLNNIAFDALITDTSKANSFLIKQATLSSAYSIKSLISQQERPSNTSNTVLIDAPFAQHAVRGLPALPNSLQETKQIASYFESCIDTNSSATFSRFQQHQSKYGLLHIASHASAGELPKLNFYDSSVFVNSIYQIPMNQSLAYLNTCQSGAGATIFSEGNLSLGRAFYSNGVHNIILTLWNMDDVSSASISALFYKNLNRTSNSITALHEAKLNYLAQHTLDKQAPYYWASVQHIGDGQLNLHHNNNLWKWIIGFGAAVGMVGIVYKRRKNKQSVIDLSSYSI